MVFSRPKSFLAESLMERFKDILAENYCPICLEKIGIKSVTNCGHVFCFECLSRWLETNKNCPFCRQNLSVENFFN